MCVCVICDACIIQVKRLNWETEHKQEALNNQFEDVLWTDESSIMMESHRRFCCPKKGTQPKPKPRYVHHHYFVLIIKLP